MPYAPLGPHFCGPMGLRSTFLWTEGGVRREGGNGRWLALRPPRSTLLWTDGASVHIFVDRGGRKARGWHGPRAKNQGPGPRPKGQGPRAKSQGARPKGQGPRAKAQGPRGGNGRWLALRPPRSTLLWTDGASVHIFVDRGGRKARGWQREVACLTPPSVHTFVDRWGFGPHFCGPRGA